MGLLAALIVAISFGCIAQHVSCQKLTGNSTGSGMTCIPDPFTLGLGQGCSSTEGELSTSFLHGRLICKYLTVASAKGMHSTGCVSVDFCSMREQPQALEMHSYCRH